MRGAVKTVVVPMRNRWTWPLAMILGLVISSVFTGLSVGLPLGLACCTSSSTFTEYVGYKGPGIPAESDPSANSHYLYRLSIDQGSSLFNQCKDVCNADSACAYFDYSDAGEFATFCFLYSANQISAITTSNDARFPTNVYLKNGYSFPSSG